MPKHNHQRPTGRDAAKAMNRQRIIDATIDSLVDNGIAGTSISEIVERAGLSRGMVNLHFKSKEQLLLEVLRHVYDDYVTTWTDALAAAGPAPEDKIRAILEADFSRKVLNTRSVGVWFTFRGEVRFHRNFMTYCDTRDRQLRKVYATIFAELIEDGGYRGLDAQELALGYIALLEGMWLDFFLHPKHFNRAKAKHICRTFLNRLFPKHFTARTGEAPPSATARGRARGQA